MAASLYAHRGQHDFVVRWLRRAFEKSGRRRAMRSGWETLPFRRRRTLVNVALCAKTADAKVAIAGAAIGNIERDQDAAFAYRRARSSDRMRTKAQVRLMKMKARAA
jgi:hypothetical protein